MSGFENVIFTLTAFGKAGDTAERPQGLECVIPPCNQLVNITLMPDVKNNLVLRHVIDTVQRQCQFYHTQIRRQMSSPLRNRLDQLLPDLSCKHIQFLIG